MVREKKVNNENTQKKKRSDKKMPIVKENNLRLSTSSSNEINLKNTESMVNPLRSSQKKEKLKNAFNNLVSNEENAKMTINELTEEINKEKEAHKN